MNKHNKKQTHKQIQGSAIQRSPSICFISKIISWNLCLTLICFLFQGSAFRSLMYLIESLDHSLVFLGAVPREVTLSSGNSITKDGREDEGRDVAGPQCALIRTFLRLVWQPIACPARFCSGDVCQCIFFIREGFDYHLSQTGSFQCGLGSPGGKSVSSRWSFPENMENLACKVTHSEQMLHFMYVLLHLWCLGFTVYRLILGRDVT